MEIDLNLDLWPGPGNKGKNLEAVVGRWSLVVGEIKSGDGGENLEAVVGRWSLVVGQIKSGDGGENLEAVVGRWSLVVGEIKSETQRAQRLREGRRG
jgi:hypothetical protein